MNIIEYLKNIDTSIFKFIHINMSNAVFDAIMPLVRIPYFWAPVYLFLLVFMWKKYKYQGLKWCLFFFITFSFCDFISASIIKKWVMRVRPCNDESLQYIIRKIVGCGSGFSFPSSHAANHFGLSFFMIFTLKHKYKYIAYYTIAWALLVCFAQVYVGVHYPFDIVGGALLGFIIAKFVAYYFHTKVNLD